MMGPWVFLDAPPDAFSGKAATFPPWCWSKSLRHRARMKSAGRSPLRERVAHQFGAGHVSVMSHNESYG